MIMKFERNLFPLRYPAFVVVTKSASGGGVDGIHSAASTLRMGSVAPTEESLSVYSGEARELPHTKVIT